MATILVVDDDAHIREVIQYALTRGTRCRADRRRRGGGTRLQAGGIDLLRSTCSCRAWMAFRPARRLRDRGGAAHRFPSSRGEELIASWARAGRRRPPAQASGPREPVTRINAVLRRATRQSPAASSGARIAHGPVALDTARHETTVNDVRVELTVTEFGILRTLLEARGRVLTRGQLIDSVREADTHITERTVDTHIRRIRAKLRPHGFDPIETVHGLGYKAAALPT
jgi:two-component system OmpR family response regulator